ncbi:hypothetical protein ABTK16_20550, partial [Acinetobacter baumannii]
AGSKVEDLGLTIAQRVDHVDSCTGHATFDQLGSELLGQVKGQIEVGGLADPFSDDVVVLASVALEEHEAGRRTRLDDL